MPGIECRYYLFDLGIQFFVRGKDLLLQLFNQMRFQIPYMVFYCWFALGFSGRRRKNNRTVKILQIRERGL